MLTVGFIAVTLEAFVLCRDASARREPGAVATVLAIARRLLLGTWSAELLIVDSAALRPTPPSSAIGQRHPPPAPLCPLDRARRSSHAPCSRLGPLGSFRTVRSSSGGRRSPIAAWPPPLSKGGGSWSSCSFRAGRHRDVGEAPRRRRAICAKDGFRATSPDCEGRALRPVRPRRHPQLGRAATSPGRVVTRSSERSWWHYRQVLCPPRGWEAQ